MQTAAGKNLKAEALLKRKGSGEGVVELIRSRTKLQIENPKADRLSGAVIDALMSVLPSFSGSLLDVGCWSGWLYHFVKDRVDYQGIDNYPEAIQVATEFFPAERFSLEDLRQTKRTADIVWATQLHPEQKVEEILPLLAGMAKKRLFWTGYRDSKNLFKQVREHGNVYEGVK